MTLARSLFTGVTGLKTHQMKLDIIGDNIANVNTTGFKRSKAGFETMFSMTLAGPVAPESPSFGGVNAIEIGLGASIAQTNQIFTQGGLDMTGRREDFAVDGRGFFAVQDGKTEEILYTRDGSLRLTPPPTQESDEYQTDDGPYMQYLVTANGQFVTGTMFEEGVTRTNLPAPELRDKIYIPLGKPIEGQKTDSVDINGQLRSSGTIASACGILSSEDLLDVGAVNDVRQRVDLTSSLVNLRRKTSSSQSIFLAGQDYEISAKVGGRTTVTYNLAVDAGTTVEDLLRIYQDVLNVTNNANGALDFELSGTADAATTTSLTDATLVGKDPDTYKGKRVYVLDAGNNIYSRIITNLDNITGTISLDSPISTLAAGDEFTIIDTSSKFIQAAAGVTASTINFQDSAADFHAQIVDASLQGLSESDVLGKHIKVMQATAAGNDGIEANIIGYDSSTGTIILDKAATVANFPGGLGSRVSISIQNDYDVPTYDSTNGPSWVTFKKDNNGIWQSRISLFGNFGTAFDIGDVTVRKAGDFSNNMTFTKVASATGESVFTTTTVYDTGGNAIPLNAVFFLEESTSNNYVFHYVMMSPGQSLKTPEGTPLNPNQIVDEGQVFFNYNGNIEKVVSQVNAASSADGHVSITFPRPGYVNGVSSFTFDTAFNHLKAIDVDAATVDMDQAGGYTAGNLTDYSVGQDGLITGVYSNGQTGLLGQMPLVQFKNEEGLLHVGANLFQETLNSGEHLVVAAGSSSAQTENGLTPTIRQRTLEDSNVDLAKEFTDMIVAQRGYQANARTITVTNQILQELLNLI